MNDKRAKGLGIRDERMKREKRQNTKGVEKKEEDKYSFFHFSFFILLSSFIRPLAIFSLFIFLATASVAPGFAQPTQKQRVEPWWLTLEQGKLQFRAGQYGDALLTFEDARRERRSMYEQMERDLISLLSINAVRRLGDSLDRVEKYAYERYYTTATAALEELYYRIPKESLDNSAAKALTALGSLKDYPEAEYWIGEVYRVEGELPLALSQYQRAYDMRDKLEDKGFGVTLQYKIASVLATRQDFEKMETVYASIINEFDTLWANAESGTVLRMQNAAGNNNPPIPYDQASASFATRAMNRTLEREGINKFMELYRYNNSAVEPAHRQFGFYLVVRGRDTADDHLMFAFLIQNTVIIEEIRRRQFDFTFTDLPALAAEIKKYPILLSYIEEVEYYKTIYYFAMSLYWNGKANAARTLWEFLASEQDAGEWRGRAITQLRSPRQEIVERR